MTMSAGARLGPYQLLALLGAGGMGEVYKARDTRLDRTVALKILPEQFADDSGRRERFEREARAVAALNHPHICDLHDIGEDQSVRFLVMEYLEGQTLAERVLRGPLPPAEVLRCAIELADALDHAHRRGLVHRDLKPGNVMLTKSGAKLLDFGLSKLQATPDLVVLSTLSPAGGPLTADGALLGTFPYMAPEQLAGHEADARSDIFAFGAIVYEIATGRRAFEGTTAGTVIGAVLHTDPPRLSSLQPLVPPALDRIVGRCLAKDPDNRWQTARDLLLELKWMAEHVVPQPSGDVPRSSKKRAVVTTATLVVLAFVIVVFTSAYFGRDTVETPAVRFTFSPPPELRLAEVRFGGPVTVSPDGRQLVYVATGSDEKQRLWIHPLDMPTPRSLAGTDGAAYPFWSPDSRSVGFFAEGRLKRIDVGGGPPQTLTDVVLPRGGTWNRDAMILFSAGGGRELYRLPAAGGVPVSVPADGINEERQWPSFLPDGRHFVYFGRRKAPGIYVGALETGATTLLASGLYMGVAYAPPGYLLFSDGGSMAGTLFARAFDASRRQFTGAPVPVTEQVPFYPFFARADFSVSENGTLLFGTFGGQPTELVWFDRAGKQIGKVPGAAGYSRAALSPDEKTIAADRLDPHTQSQDVWLIETTRGVTSRLTTNPGHDQMGLWSPDGARIIYGSTREGEVNGTRMKALSGPAMDERLFASDDAQNRQVTDWSPDGKLIVHAKLDAKTKWDLWVLPSTVEPASNERRPTLYLQTEFNEHHGRVSPDGEWMAYASDESGRSEVYVQAFPVPGVRSQVSTSGGDEPYWRRDGQELFYRSADRLLTAVPVKTGTSFTSGAPQPLFRLPIADIGPLTGIQNSFLPTTDGQRFLINAVIDEPAPPPVTVIINWPAVLPR
jgi:Tol biopolymer transport system component/predicted Ser/Thr protein kinase